MNYCFIAFLVGWIQILYCFVTLVIPFDHLKVILSSLSFSIVLPHPRLVLSFGNLWFFNISSRIDELPLLLNFSFASSFYFSKFFYFQLDTLTCTFFLCYLSSHNFIFSFGFLMFYFKSNNQFPILFQRFWISGI